MFSQIKIMGKIERKLKKLRKVDEAIKYVQDCYCIGRPTMPYLLLGDVAALIEILTGEKINWEILEKYKK